MKSTVKAVIFDIDGTAIPSGRWAHTSPRLQAVVKVAVASGLVLAPATGRNYKFCRYILDELQIVSPAIVAAGTQIIEPKSGNELWSAKMSIHSCSTALAKLLPYQCKILIDDDTPEEALTVANIKPGNYRLLDVQDIEVDKVDGLVDELLRDDRLSVMKVNSHNEGMINLHVTDVSATKRHAVDVWLRLVGLDKAEVVGVGDSYNDLELFKSVGYAVAMGNAVPELKALSDLVIDSVDEDGLAKYIESLVG